VDYRARSNEIAQALAARFQTQKQVAVVDLGCGTGSNLRATVSLLPSEQQWTLVDFDEQLLAVAKRRLMDWADRAEADADGLVLDKDGKRISVRFQRADLNRDLDSALGPKPDLVTASALFDLCSAAFIKTLARKVAERRAVFCTVLTYNGIQRWTPRQPGDTAMIAAFHAHQMTDKGFGSSAGPTAPAHLADAFRLAGYSVLEGDSPWSLGLGDKELLHQLASGFADAVSETGKVDAKTIDTWRQVTRTGAIVGHTDTLATPA
jgi:SAM-dependent methyltransferase